jgi:NADPH:quinone reductase-like Zn-dependent oxidoreductase
MRALLLTKSGDTPPTLTLETVPKPVLTPGHLLLKVHASSIQPSDLLNAAGNFPMTTYPRIPGRDYAGTIIEPSSRAGEAVYGTSGSKQAFTVDGAQAEYMLVPENAVAPLPKGVSFVQAATLGVPFTTAATALKRTGAKEGEYVLVLGANGAVGSAVVQLAKGMGCKVLQGSRKEDADVNTSSDPEMKAVDKLTDGKGVDVVVDTVGSPALTAAAVAKLARRGRLGFIAGPRSGSKEMSFDMVDFYRSERSILGVNTLVYGVEEFAEELKGVSEMFEKGLLKVEAEWTQIKLEDGVEAYKKAGQKGAGKFVIVMN